MFCFNVQKTSPSFLSNFTRLDLSIDTKHHSTTYSWKKVKQAILVRLICNLKSKKSGNPDVYTITQMANTRTFGDGRFLHLTKHWTALYSHKYTPKCNLQFQYYIMFQPYQSFTSPSSTLWGDRHMRLRTSLYEIQFQTTFIPSFF